MKFVNRHNHMVSTVDGREVPSFGDVEMTAEQYQNPEQWRQLPELFVAASSKGQDVIDAALADPDKYNKKAEASSADATDNGGQT